MSEQSIELAFAPTWQEARAAMAALGRRARPRPVWKPLAFLLGVVALVGLGIWLWPGWFGRWLTLPTLFAFVAGIYVMLGVVIWKGRWQWRHLGARWEAHQARLGIWRMGFGRAGYHIRTEVSEVRAGWDIVSEVMSLPGGTGLLVGTAILTVPDAALPEGLTPEAFRARLEAWRAA
ncbi:MAG: hypothetical protein JXQ91_20755 [Vannielia sp.]|uniref:hypothetical protein n=1 Tax=Vannielia sp. TaxID=2813045 RepID=UPI003B8AF80B